MSDVIHLVCPHCAAVNRVPSGRLSDSPKCGKCAKSVFPGKSVAVDSTVFDKHVTRNDIPVLVDFWAPWCGPCKMMAPTFEQVAAEMEPNVRLLKVDTEQNPTLAARFGIRSIPTLAVFKGGKEVARQAGAMDAQTLKRWVLSSV
ncbi:MAG: thioredoxin TrxC [Granulosicoccaceae bacterium]